MKTCANCKTEYDPTEVIRTTVQDLDDEERVVRFEITYDVKMGAGKKDSDIKLKNAAICPKCAGSIIFSKVTSDEAKIAVERMKKAREDAKKLEAEKKMAEITAAKKGDKDDAEGEDNTEDSVDE